MIDLKSVDQKRLVTLIEKAPSGMPEPPNYSVTRAQCWRCGGAGGSDAWKHTGWTCYRCGGEGKDPTALDYLVKLETASPEWAEWASAVISKRDATNTKRQETLRLKRVAEQEKKDAEHVSKVTAYIEADPLLKEAVRATEALEKADGFAANVLESVLKNLSMSDKQKNIIERGLERVAEKAAEEALPKLPVPEGRIEITGKVKGFKETEDRFTYGGGTILKMIVQDDRGFKVYGTVPSGLRLERGDRVTFRATVEQSRDDEFFGFFKRPAKADVTEEVNAG